MRIPTVCAQVLGLALAGCLGCASFVMDGARAGEPGADAGACPSGRVKAAGTRRCPGGNAKRACANGLTAIDAWLQPTRSSSRCPGERDQTAELVPRPMRSSGAEGSQGVAKRLASNRHDSAKGRSSSRMRKTAPETDTAQTTSAARVVVLAGASSAKPANMIVPHAQLDHLLGVRTEMAVRHDPSHQAPGDDAGERESKGKQ